MTAWSRGNLLAGELPGHSELHRRKDLEVEPRDFSVTFTEHWVTVHSSH